MATEHGGHASERGRWQYANRLAVEPDASDATRLRVPQHSHKRATLQPETAQPHPPHSPKRNDIHSPSLQKHNIDRMWPSRKICRIEIQSVLATGSNTRCAPFAPKLAPQLSCELKMATVLEVPSSVAW